MITLRRLNVVKVVPDQAAADKLIAKGYKKMDKGGSGIDGNKTRGPDRRRSKE